MIKFIFDEILVRRNSEMLFEKIVQLPARIAEFFAKVVYVAGQQFIVLRKLVEQNKIGGNIERRRRSAEQDCRNKQQKRGTDKLVVFLILFGIGIIHLQKDLFNFTDLVSGKRQAEVVGAEVIEQTRREPFDRILQERLFYHDIDITHGFHSGSQQAMHVARGRYKHAVGAVSPDLSVGAIVDLPVRHDRKFPIVLMPVFDRPVEQIDVVKKIDFGGVLHHVQRRALIKIILDHCNKSI